MASSPRIDLIEGVSNVLSSLAQVQGLNTLMDTSSTNLVSVPFTTIVGRAPIVNLANDVRVGMGINRIVTQQLFPIQTEVGPAGQPVYGVLNDILGRMRFVGQWFTAGQTDAGNWGPSVESITTGDYLEITFWGVGLNLLFAQRNILPSFQVSVDGGGTSTFWNTNGVNAPIIAHVPSNAVIPVVSNLTLGLHTVIITNNASNANAMPIFGFEILQPTTLTVNPGNIYGLARKGTLATQQTPSYNSGFASGSLGTTGGRVLAYLNSSNGVALAATPVPGASSLGTSANHINEELARTFYISDFGAGLSTDFSNLANTSANFTLDDGSTSLAGSSISLANNTPIQVVFLTGGASILFTFVGTGLDLLLHDNTTNGVTPGDAAQNTFQIDGGVAQNWPYTSSSTTVRTIKIASGLPYGSHVLQITRISPAVWVPQIAAFKVYQPVTPSLPSGAIELARYNVMANYVANSGNSFTMSTGVLWKQIVRETTFNGTWAAPSQNFSISLGGNYIGTGANGDTFTRVFYGTGFECSGVGSAASSTITVTIDGALYTGAATVNGSGNSWTAGTGTWTLGTSSANPLQITGLTLGYHKVLFTRTSSSGIPQVQDFRMITPIHAYKSILPGDNQNTLLIGSQGISDSRSITAISKAKAIVQAVGLTNQPSTTSASDVYIPEMSASVFVQGYMIEVNYNVCFFTSASGVNSSFTIYVDGALAGVYKSMTTFGAGSSQPQEVSDNAFFPVSPGYHRVDISWSTGGTLSGSGTRRNMSVREV